MKQSSFLAGLALGVMTLAPQSAEAAAPSGAREERPSAEQRSITTHGSGEERVRPDSFRVSVGVEAQAETVDKAQNEVNTKMQRVIQELNRLRIPGLVLQTQTLQLYPIREVPQGDELPKIIGYRAANSVTATVRGGAYEDLGAQASKIVDIAARAGANDIGGIAFFVSDDRDAQTKALQAAVRDAERNARAMADAAGVSLGEIESLEGGPERSGPMFRAVALEARGAPTPIEIGESVITARVTARFAFRRK
jgi:hypothetical protein